MAWSKRQKGWTKAHKVAATVAVESRKGDAMISGSPQQEAIWDVLLNGDENLVVEALAGTGKTFTVTQGLLRMKPMRYGEAAFVAFNKSIAEELKTKVPSWVQASTFHSMLFGIYKEWHREKIKVDDYKTENLFEKLVGEARYEKIRKEDQPLIVNTIKLVSLCKATLAGFDIESREWIGVQQSELVALCDHFGIDCNGSTAQVFDFVIQLVEQSRTLLNVIDFDDMLWLPVVHNIPQFRQPRYKLLCVDEAQDLNMVQQVAAVWLTERLWIVGDKNQAIYGFRGADVNSMSNVVSMLQATKRGVTVLPLTQTRRCPKKIVQLAAQIVPTFEALPEAPEGEIHDMLYEKAMPAMQPGDLVVCRTNAPVVSTAFRLIRMGVRANIQGRDIGRGLIALVKKLSKTIGTAGSDVLGLQTALQAYESKESARLLAKKNASKRQLESLQDKCACLAAFFENATKVDDVIRKIEEMFVDSTADKKKVLLSSVHRAKGLESETVWILEPEKMPHPMAELPWERQQEMNIKYVALTRSKNKLISVISPETVVNDD